MAESEPIENEVNKFAANLKGGLFVDSSRVIYRYYPKTKKNQKLIQQGEYPDGFDLFLICIRNHCQTEGVKLVENSIAWFRYEKDPFITFAVEKDNKLDS